MKKLLKILICVIFFTAFCYGEEEKCSLAGFSAGYTWFHDYADLSKSGMNINLFYEPAVTKYLNIDNALLLNLNWKDAESGTLFQTGKKDYYLMPQYLIGPRGGIQFFNRLSVFAGGGLSFSVGISYFNETRDVKASFSPGFYLKAGFDLAVAKTVALGLEFKYNWSVVQIPHLLSLNLRLSYRHRSAVK